MVITRTKLPKAGEWEIKKVKLILFDEFVR